MEKIFERLFNVLTEPVQIVLLSIIFVLVYIIAKAYKIISRLLTTQESRGIVLTKITVMLEAMFNDSRRDK